MGNKIEIAIVGGGPAGMATAIQLARFDLHPILFEKKRLGGLLWNAQWVENYPGFHGGISGPQLVGAFTTHLETYGIPVVQKEVQRVRYMVQRGRFLLEMPDNTFEADILVMATGTIPKTAGIFEGIPTELQGFVHYEVVPLLQEKGKSMVVMGAGDIAFDYALNLSSDNEVIILHRHEKIKALPLLQRRVQQTPGIKTIGRAELMQVEKGDTRPLKITYTQNKDHQPLLTTLECDHLVLAIGRESLLPGLDHCFLENKGGLITQGRLYFAGDVVNGRYRQVAIATGNGIETAMKIYEQRY